MWEAAVEPIVIDRAEGAAGGELVLRRAGDAYEIISNGVFLMDTRNGESERLLVRAALDALGTSERRGGPGGDEVRLLIGGLGVGFSLAEAVRSEGVTVTVVELERAVIDWHATHLGRFSGGALDDARVNVLHADLPAFLRTTARRFDAICLDIDNGPDWTVTESNAELYDEAGLRLLGDRLTRGGVLAVWSAHAVPAFERRLHDHFTGVSAHPVPVSRGEPDVIYLARRR